MASRLIKADKAALISGGYVNKAHKNHEENRRRQALLADVSNAITQAMLRRKLGVQYEAKLKNGQDDFWLQQQLRDQKYRVTSWATGTSKITCMTITWNGESPPAPTRFFEKYGAILGLVLWITIIISTVFFLQ